MLRRDRFETEMQSELETHIELYVADLIARGVPRIEAERRARAEFGSIEATKDDCRDASGFSWVDELRRNLRYAIRLLRKSPGFTLAAVATLGLCIGANTAIFSVVDAVLLRPLPYPEPHRLAQVVLHFERQGQRGDSVAQTGRTWAGIKESATFVDAAVYSGGVMGISLSTDDSSQYVQRRRVSAGFFRVLGVQPFLGREFTEAEDRDAGPAATILSHRLWRRTFGEDPAIIGKQVSLRGEPHTVVGVAPAGFESEVAGDVWTPVRVPLGSQGRNHRILVRLLPDTTWSQAESQIRAIGQPLLDEWPLPPDVRVKLRLLPLQDGLTLNQRMPLFLLWSAAGFFLLIGCVNIAGLLIARASGRSREIAIRLALGGGRAGIVRQLLTESFALAALGGIAGIGLGYLGMHLIQTFGRESMGIWQTVQLDLRVLLVTMALSLFTGILFGLLPAIQASRYSIKPQLGEGGDRSVAGARTRWPRRILVAVQVALSVVLLAGAAATTRTIIRLWRLDPGFDATNIVTANLSLHQPRYSRTEKVNRLFEQSLARIRDLPGVVGAAVALTPPYMRPLNMPFRVMEGALADEQNLITDVNYVTPGYFEALRAPLLSGRLFRDTDTTDAHKVVIVNRVFVEQYLQDGEVLGRHLALAGTEDPREIVGVVSDILQKPGWGHFGPLGMPPAAYIPASQAPNGFLSSVHSWMSPHWIVRTRGPQPNLVAGMSDALQAEDPELLLAGFATFDDIKWQFLAGTQFRFLATIFLVLAGFALLLAAIGIYGLIANSVVERTRELGIRIALGASVSRAIRTAATPGVILATLGILIGGGLSLAIAPVMSAFVWGVSPTDPASLFGVAAVLLLVATAASLLPSLRLLHLNPAQTLREE